MDEIVCEICVKEFNESDVVPRVLECGHSVCTDCITQLLETTRSCPKCSNEMTHSSCEEYLVNHSLIGITNSLKNSPIPKSILRRQMEKLIKEYLAMETKWTDSKEKAESNLNLITDRLDQITDSITQLQELSDADDDDWDIESTNKTLLELKANLETTRNLKTLEYPAPLDLKDFPNTKIFLLEIYHGIIRGDHYYAVTKIADRVKFGKISLQDNKIFIHAFGSIELDLQPKFVSLQDIKRCLSEGNFGAFLEIICNGNGIRQKILIKMLSTILTPQFLRFCTGESGPAYKSSSFYKGTTAIKAIYPPSSIIKVDKLIESDEKAAEYMVYDTILKFSHSYKCNDIILTTSLDGDFEICKLVADSLIQNVIGKIDEPNNLETLVNVADHSKIIDSGIVIYM